MVYKYLVQCWITPRTGFDLAKKSHIMQLFKSIMEETFPDDVKVEDAVKRFAESHDGLILEPLVIESDTEVIDFQKEILPEIQKTYPEATIFSCEKMPEFIPIKE